ncbi:hypothetical protein RIF29_08223 [Crotalaria pallida]|uniref:Uncharacterized protein n=1 Tax=Crotalaria pallida TaxID=3830 RepID=A0AAN9PCI2_CROPI
MAVSWIVAFEREGRGQKFTFHISHDILISSDEFQTTRVPNSLRPKTGAENLFEVLANIIRDNEAERRKTMNACQTQGPREPAVTCAEDAFEDDS